MSDKNYKVYIHTCNINGKKYIGITKLNLIDRWGTEGQGYKNQIFYRAIKKYGWNNFTHEIVCSGLTKEEAESKEVELISKHNSNNSSYGYNVENGGTCNEVSEETKLKIQKKQRENPHKNTKVYKYSIDGNFITEYISVSQASRENKVSFGAIFACLRGDTNQSGGFQWKIADGNTKSIGKYHKVPNTNDKLMKKVIKFSLDGIKIEEYKSLAEARSSNRNSSHISECCKGKRMTACGYQWEFA